MITSILRSPNTREWIDKQVFDGLEDFEMLFKNIPLFDKSGNANSFGIQFESLREWLNANLSVNVPSEYVHQFASYPVVVAQPTNELFCLSEMPFIRYEDFRHGKIGKANEYWFLLSKDLAFCFLMNSRATANQYYINFPDQYVRRLNYDLANRGRYVVSSCPIQLHKTVKNFGIFPDGRDFSERSIEDFH